MKPLKIELQAFGPYEGYEYVDFEAVSSKGLFLICGKTGTGKTTILDAISFALYGRSSGHLRDDFLAMRCTGAKDETPTFVRFEFENSGKYYLFERRIERKRKNYSSSCSMMVREPGGSWNAAFENPKERDLNKIAVEITGLEYDQFRQVIVLPQGQFEKFLTSNADEKEKILTRIFGEEKWQRIAELIFREASENRDELKKTDEKIKNALLEENCLSIEALRALIAQKSEELSELDRAFDALDYDNETKRLQRLMALAGRFSDLHREEMRLTGLQLKKDENEDRKKRLDGAARAEKVRDLINNSKNLKTAFELRQKNSEEALKKSDIAREKYQSIHEKFRRLALNKTVIEKKTEERIVYEGKIAAYENIEQVAKDLEDKLSYGERLKKEEAALKKKYESYLDEMISARESFSALTGEHAELLEKYLAGITGELARTLEDGKPCPVCGSLTHPGRAPIADSRVTKAMVDTGKKAADDMYRMLQDKMAAQDEAKKLFDEKHAEAEKALSEAAVLKAKKAELQKNLVPGIDSLIELKERIRNLENEAGKYYDSLELMEKSEITAKDEFTSLNALVEPAQKEAENARALFESSVKNVEKGLAENGFSCEEEAEGCMMDEREAESQRRLISEYEAAVKAAQKHLSELVSELSGIAEPDEDECLKKLEELSNAQKEYFRKKGVLTTQIGRLSDKQKRIESEVSGLDEKIRCAENDLQFAKKLRGDSGTGLQRYVLGIMFSSVITAANRMLAMVHGGRYRLFRSDDSVKGSKKKGLELKVFDKYSGDREGRFVNTLSGGEKFLVSLALSIGLSTVAQKSGIRIEALFIDEGFGSLDEDSITDAMNVLDSIREANGMVGIISHVKLLQERIPVKLMVEDSASGSHIIQTIG